MNKRKLDPLLWERIPFENFIINGHSIITQENLDDVFWDDVDELFVSRDEDYNIEITCTRYLNRYKGKKQRPKAQNDEIVLGATRPKGKLVISIKLFK